MVMRRAASLGFKLLEQLETQRPGGDSEVVKTKWL